MRLNRFGGSKSVSAALLKEQPSGVLDLGWRKPLSVVVTLKVLIQYFIFLFFALLFEFRFL
jgi:hypothetical protein